MSYKGFYKHIYLCNDGKYCVMKGAEKYLQCDTLEEALYERDRMINVGWDWDLYVLLPDTINAYIHINLPPFNHQASYIVEESECWVVREKGAKQKYRGAYYSEDEAKRVARIYNANINHKPKRYVVRRSIDGEKKFFGRYKTRKEAEDRVEELMENNWSK